MHLSSAWAPNLNCVAAMVNVVRLLLSLKVSRGVGTESALTCQEVVGKKSVSKAKRLSV